MSSAEVPKVGHDETVLSNRHYKTVCTGSFSLFAALFLCLGLNEKFSKQPICSATLALSSWAREWTLVALGGLTIAVCMQLNRIFLSTFRENGDIGTLSSYYASLVVNLIALTSHAGTALWQWGGICKDGFGVLTPAVTWIEWAVTVPLLAFITLSVDDKPSLSRGDLHSIVSLHLCIVCGAALQITSSISVAIVLLALSCVFVLPSFTMLWSANDQLDRLVKASAHAGANKGSHQRKILLASRKASLATCLGYLLPVFPVIYFARLFHFLDDDAFFVGITYASALTKILFASLCMDAHLEISHPAIALLDAEKFSHTSRRAFLRYVFHEVRVPLNSITLGLEVLDGSDLPTAEDQQTVKMLKEAAAVMNETLNDVMALQKVEEGSLELVYKSFSLVDLFQNVEDAFIDSSVERGVTLSTDIDSRLSARFIGDKYRLHHVLANLVSNAIKYSHEGGVVQLRARMEVTVPAWHSAPTTLNGEFINVTFIVQDKGDGISEEDQAEDIFQPFRRLKHGEMKTGRGTGLGMAICREIVRMHSGRIWYESVLGQGSTFYVSLPLEVDKATSSHVPSSWQRNHRRRHRRSAALSSHYNVLMATKDMTTPQSRLASPIQLDGSASSSSDKLSRTPASGKSLLGQQSSHRFSSRGFDDIRSFRSPSGLGVEFVDLQPSADAAAEEDENDDAVQIDLAHLQSALSPDQQSCLNPGNVHLPVNVIKPVPQLQFPPAVCDVSDSIIRQEEDRLPAPQLCLNPSEQPIGEEDLRCKRFRVLIVDDVNSNRKFLGWLINKRGIESVSFAEDGLYAVDSLRDKGIDGFDIIFMDNTMPRMTGIAAATAMRQLGYRNLLIGITGNSMENELVEFVQAGADLVVTKPLKPYLLDLLLNFAVDRGCLSAPNCRLALTEVGLQWEPKH